MYLTSGGNTHLEISLIVVDLHTSPNIGHLVDNRSATGAFDDINKKQFRRIRRELLLAHTHT
jgi:hypothetical protein